MIFVFSAIPSSGNIITLAQFIFISIKGFILESKFGAKKPVIPLKYFNFEYSIENRVTLFIILRKYMSLVIMFFIVSVLNNYALNFNISMPLHMIFRSVSKSLVIINEIIKKLSKFE